MRRLAREEGSRCLFDRRSFVAGIAAGLLGGCGGIGGSGRSRANSKAQGGLAALLPVRAEPLQLELYPESTLLLSESELKAVARVGLPPLRLKKYPIAVVYHAVRLWGRAATFSECEFARPELRGCFGRRMVDIMLDDGAFQSLSAALVDRLMEPSQYGVLVRTTQDGGWGYEAASTHPGTYLQVLGELGVPSGERLRLVDGGEFTVADVVRDDARRVHPDGELEWVANGLGRYVGIRQWQNRFGEWVGFDAIAESLLRRPLGRGACLGTHVPYALAALASLQQQESLISAANQTRIIQRLQEIVALLSERQRKDGAWDGGWFGESEQPSQKPPVFDVDLESIEATGHHLEWMTICPPQWRPAPEVIARAATYLAKTLPEVESFVTADWHRYLPFSHAVKALFGLQGKAFAV